MYECKILKKIVRGGAWLVRGWSKITITRVLLRYGKGRRREFEGFEVNVKDKRKGKATQRSKRGKDLPYFYRLPPLRVDC